MSEPELMERRRARRGLRVTFPLFAIFLSCATLLAAQTGASKPSSAEEFFIVSSVDISKGQLLVKQPTEITELLQVNDKTRYTDKNGKAMQFAELRAGDTVYIRSTAARGGKVALSIRKAPMSVEELHRRYLK